MREEAVVVLRLDTGDLPAKSQQAAKSLQQIGTTGEISARQTAAAMRQLPAQLTDVATSLAGGQNPLLVLLQQGGQVKDSFGGLGPAIRGVASAISPLALGIGAAAAAMGILATAAYKGAEQDEALRDSLALTGNAAGLTASRLDLLSERVEAASQQTVGGAREIALALANSGQVSAKALDSTALAVARVADVSGQSGSKVAADFATMAGGVAKWAAEHNKTWNFITVEQYKYIRRLEEQGKAEEAMIYTNQQVLKALEGQQKNLGLLERGWDGLGKAASAAWDAMLGIGRDQTTRQQLDIALDRLNALGGNLTPKAREAAEQRIQFLKEQLKLEEQQAAVRSKNAADNRRGIADERDKEGKAPELKFGAIRNAREQYRQDFLRSEKALYDDLAKQDAAAIAAGLKDPLGEFITEQVLPAQARRDEQRLTQNANFLQGLLDDNERAAAQLIQDELARGERLIEIDRQVALRRADAQGLVGGARDEAQRLINERAGLAREQLYADLQKDADKAAAATGQANYQAVRNALTAAFNDSKNPAKAFAQAFASEIFSRTMAAMTDAMAAAMVGKDGKGGGFGDLVGWLSSINGGGMSVDTNGMGITPADGSIALPTRGGMATGTNLVPRDMIVKVHKGEAIVPAKYNPAAGGQGRGAAQVTFSPQISIDSRTDREQVAQLVYGAVSESQQRMLEDLRARGVAV